MRILHAAAALALLCSSANAQSVVDGSGKEIAPDLLKLVVAKVSANLRDPLAAQFRRISAGTARDGNAICGEVNGKNVYGGYVGFEGFIFYRDVSAADVYSGSYDKDEVKKELAADLKEVGCPVY